VTANHVADADESAVRVPDAESEVRYSDADR